MHGIVFVFIVGGVIVVVLLFYSFVVYFVLLYIIAHLFCFSLFKKIYQVKLKYIFYQNNISGVTV